MESLNKSVLRARLREILRSIPAEERAAGSQSLCDVLRQQSEWQEARAVLGYVPLADEPDILALLEEAWRAQQTVALPRFDVLSQGYVACLVREAGELVPGRFGVREPGAHCPAISLNQLDLILVPGVAFDLSGHRLGRGKGFYDRLLAGVHGHKCGVAFTEQIVPAVPAESHDVLVNSILTPTRWHRCPPVV
jgi:5-formyltetrahydrofolate cyclo-ligase